MRGAKLVAQAGEGDDALGLDDCLNALAHRAQGVRVGIQVTADADREPRLAQGGQLGRRLSQLADRGGLVARGAQALGERQRRGSEGGWRRRDAGRMLRSGWIGYLAALQARESLDQLGATPVTARAGVEHDPAAQRVGRRDRAHHQPVARRR